MFANNYYLSGACIHRYLARVKNSEQSTISPSRIFLIRQDGRYPRDCAFYLLPIDHSSLGPIRRLVLVSSSGVLAAVWYDPSSKTGIQAHTSAIRPQSVTSSNKN